MRTNSAAILRSALSASTKQGTLSRFLSSLSAVELRALNYDFELWARDDQLPPEAAQGGGDWTDWLMLGGRGAGKTRAGAEWVRAVRWASRRGRAGGASRWSARRSPSARSVMIEGVSGLLAVHPPASAAALRAVEAAGSTWPNGAVAQVFSAEDPESLRGPQFDAAWCDELAKWRHADETWDMLQFGLRLGDAPRQVVTTTPRPIPLMQSLLADPRDRGEPGGDRGQRGQSRAGFSERDGRPLCAARGSAARNSTAR